MPGRIPQSFIDDLVERIDIVDVIDARVKLKRVGKNYQACCPFHEEKTPSFNVNAERGLYKCFGCGVGGNVLTFLIEHDRLEFVDAIEALAKIAGVEVPREGGDPPPKPDTDLYILLENAAKLFWQTLTQDEFKDRVTGYLKSRDVTGVIAKEYRIGFAPPGWNFLKTGLGGDPEKLIKAGLLKKNDNGQIYDIFRDRIMFPIRDTRGRVLAFGGRVLPGDDNGAKYMNSPETPVFHKSRELYGLYEARQALRQIDRLIVVEGYMDVVVLARHGIANVVATLGTAVAITHFEKLYKNTAEVVCCFDGDAAGREGAWRALQACFPVLRDGRQLRFIFLPDGEDPDSLIRSHGKVHFDQLIQDAIPAGEYLIARLTENLDLDHLDGRAQFAHLAMPFLRQLPEGIYRTMLLERIATIAQVSPNALESRTTVQPGRAQTSTSPPESSGLGRRLTGFLMRTPEVFAKVDNSMVEQLLQDTEDDTLFMQVVRHVAKDPATEPAPLLARFVGNPAHDELRRLIEDVSPLAEEAVGEEFREGVERYVNARSKAGRRALVRALKENGSNENLTLYWQAKKESGQA
jgi:DNA primase